MARETDIVSGMKYDVSERCRDIKLYQGNIMNNFMPLN